MATLNGRTPANTYKDLLQVSNLNSGVDTTLRALEDGEGTASSLKLSTTQMQATGNVLWTKGTDIASATALAIGTDGNYFDVTGTTTITSIGTVGVGAIVKLHFDDALTLTHHSTDLILPGAANVTTAAGDEAEFFEYAAGDWRCTSYVKASGEAVISSGGGDVSNSGYHPTRLYNGGFHDLTNATVTINADLLYAMPFRAAESVTFTGFSIYVSATGTASNARLGIYNFVNGVPTSLVLDAGVISVGTTGLKTIVIDQDLAGGLYALAVVADGTVSFYGGNPDFAGCGYVFGLDSGAAPKVGNVRMTHTYGTLPSSYTVDAYESGTNQGPSIYLSL